MAFPQETNENSFLNERDTGVYLGGENDPVKAATLRRWRCAGSGPAYHKISGLIRYRVSDLDIYLDKSRVGPEAA